MTLQFLIDKAWRENFDWIDNTYADKETHGQAQLELLQVAVCARNEEAWEAIYKIYKVQMYVWAMRVNNGYPDGTEALALRGFTRFWRTMTPERLQGFTSIRAVLGYIHSCIRSEAIDESRKARPVEITYSAKLDGAYDGYIDEVDEERAELWQRVRGHVDEREWHALVAYFVEDLPYREILRKYPDIYETWDDLFNAIRRSTKRLARRDDIVQIRDSWTT